MRRKFIALVAAASVGICGGTAFARFTSSTTSAPRVNVILPTIPRPTGVTCTWTGLIPVSTLTWTSPDPQPTYYRVNLRRSPGTPNETVTMARQVSGATTSTTLSQDLLTGLIANLLNLLLGGEVIEITVNSVYGNYESAPLYTYRLVRNVLPLGAVCQSAPAGLQAGRQAATTSLPPTTMAVTTTAHPTTSIAATTSVAPPEATSTAPTITSTTSPAPESTTGATSSTTTAPATTSTSTSTPTTTTTTTSTSTTTTTTTSSPPATTEPDGPEGTT